MMYRQLLVVRKALVVLFAVTLALSLLMAFANLSLHGADRFYSPLGFALLVLVAWSLAVFATIYGAAFAGTSREPACVLWLLPAPRWRLAAQAMAVDVVALVAAYALLVAVIYVPEIPVIGLRQVASMLAQVTWQQIVFALAFPLAIYGYSALLGVLLRRVAFAGLAVVPIGIVLALFARDPAGGLLRALAPLDPIAVFTQSAKVPGLKLHVDGFASDRLAQSLHWLTPDIGIALLFLLGILSCAAAVGVWSRAQIESRA